MRPVERVDVAIVGSGFAGSILARALHRQGLRVLLLERQRHPRFALGESSTPLAAICLERLASRYELPDLGYLAAYGRWRQHLPDVRHGLKRGFTFYRHRAGSPFQNRPENDHRLLVAASPEDAVADSHWLREDVDRHLVDRAVAEGVDYRDLTEVELVELEPTGRWKLSASQEGRAVQFEAMVLIDGSGSGGLLARSLPIDSSLSSVDLDTALVFGHFRGVRGFTEVAEASGAHLDPGPYVDERAAVHHLLDEGWMYVLPFDHDLVSAGIILGRRASAAFEAAASRSPSEIWRRVMERYLTLEDQFADAVAVRPMGFVPRLQRWLARAAGPNWALLPHSYAFFDPMFSTGIAWSLLAVERLGLVFEEARAGDGLSPSALASGLRRYRRLLHAETRQLLALLQGAHLAKTDFGLFTAHSFLYFAVVSFEEVYQRLRGEPSEVGALAWRGFLGAGDARLENAYQEAERRLAAIHRQRDGELPKGERTRFERWVAETIASHNIAGLSDASRSNLYPVDFELVVARAGLLGLTPVQVRAALPRLRGR